MAQEQKVWYKSSDGWELGTILSEDSDSNSVVILSSKEGSGGKEVTVARELTCPSDPTHFEVDMDDLCGMNHVHEASILHVLQERYKADKIYTSIGTVLLSINPYKEIEYERSDIEDRPHLNTIAKAAYTVRYKI